MVTIFLFLFLFSFYGSYPIFGDYDLQSEFFFTNWILAFMWFVFLLMYKDQLVGWFMIPSTMQEATHMYVWTKNEVNYKM